MADTLMAFDFGAKRVGVAIGEPLIQSATPLSTLEVPASQVLDAIAPLVDVWQPAKFVVGRPTHPDGTPHTMTARCEKFARQLAARFRRPYAMVDERYSSIDAQQRAGRSGARGKPIDHLSAAIILERYFESHP
jgi:putative holliday junction resolvase